MPRNVENNNVLETSLVLKALGDLSKTIQESSVTFDSFEDILKGVGEIIDFRSASVFMISPESGKLEEVSRVGRSVDLIDFVEFDMGTGISAWVAKKRRPILLNNLRKSKGGVHIRSFLSAPIVFGDEIIGVVNLAHDEPEAFTEGDSQLLEIISTLFALLAERISHQKHQTSTAREIESLNEQLKNSSFEKPGSENPQSNGEVLDTLSTKLSNSLAIIAGNAQFLLMTMKNSSNSVVRRLKAINKEASNIMDLANRREPGSNAGRDYMYISDDFDRY